jgi:hypothetical protein
MQLEFQAREHIDIATRCVTVCYEHANSGDAEQCGASFDCPYVSSNL